MQGVVVKGKRNLIRPSPHGQPQSALAKAADSGEWQDGQRFSSGASEDEVRIWAKTLWRQERGNRIRRSKPLERGVDGADKGGAQARGLQLGHAADGGATWGADRILHGSRVLTSL